MRAIKKSKVQSSGTEKGEDSKRRERRRELYVAEVRSGQGLTNTQMCLGGSTIVLSFFLPLL